MREAIHVKFLPATNHRGARLKATAKSGTATVPYPYEASEGYGAHYSAAWALAVKLGWEDGAHGMRGGMLPDGTWAFVLA